MDTATNNTLTQGTFSTTKNDTGKSVSNVDRKVVIDERINIVITYLIYPFVP